MTQKSGKSVILRSGHFVPTEGENYDLVVIFPDDYNVLAVSHAKIMKVAQEYGFLTAPLEVSPYIAEMFCGADLKAKDVSALVVMHDPIRLESGTAVFALYQNASLRGSLGTQNVPKPGYKYSPGTAFVFLKPVA